MNIKRKLFLNQLDFLRPLLGLILLIIFLYFYGLSDFTQLFQKIGFAIPNWIIYALYGIFALYALWRAFIGIIMLINIQHVKQAKSFFALTQNKTPQVKITNIAEQYALLATLFYEIANIHIYDQQAIKELAQNPNYIPPYRQNSFGHILGGSQFINSIEGLPLTNAEVLHQDLKQSLELSWGITDKASALAQINELWESANAGAEYDLLQSKEGKAYAQAVQDFGFKFASKGLPINTSAFDLVRFIYLIRSYFTLGYFDEEEVRSALLSAATFIAHHYKNWQHFAYCYLINFLIWNVASNSKTLAYGYVLERILGANQILAEQSSPLKGTSLEQLRDDLRQL